MAFNRNTSLPEPDPQALAHSRCLLDLIRSEIDTAGGCIPFSQFMQLALYAPGLGYYSVGTSKLGATGDFVTAPELSPLFSRCIARQCQQVLADTDGGGDILELGAGSGIMAATLLLELEQLGQLPERYLILEVSADLQQRQQQTMAQQAPHLLSKVQWLQQLPETGLNGIIVANEVLDALPVERFCMTDTGPKLLGVAYQNDQLMWQQYYGCNDQLSELTRSLQLPLGYQSEFNPLLNQWIQSLADSLQSGVMLFVDYGYSAREYYHPQRDDGSLICHYRHHAHNDPFFLPGLQDISASVDFTAVADAGLAAGLQVSGFCQQNYFLFGCGLEQLLAEIGAQDTQTQHYLQAVQQVKWLTLPAEMGERFKVIGLSRNLSLQLNGFSFLDQRDRL